MPDPLKTDLETAYNAVRDALKKKDMDLFLQLSEPAKEVNLDQLRAHWDEAADAMVEMYPELSRAKFLKVDQQGDWAGYYHQTDVDDANFLSIDMLKFHKVDGAWKLSGSSFGSSIQRPGNDADDEKAIDLELKTNESFAL